MDSKQIYDVAIVGAGPAGLTAAIYCLRDNKNIIIFEKEIWGGQINNSPRVENIPGFVSISGADFVKNLEEQVRSISSNGSFAEEYTEVLNVIRERDLFKIECDDENTYFSKTVIFATGTKHRLLNVPGEEELIGNGISFCSICDAPFCVGRDVAVIGGGNSALIEAIELSRYANVVFLVQNLDYLTAEASLINEVDKLLNLKVIVGATVTDFEKNDKITVWYSTYSNETKELVEHNLKVDNVFLAVGLIPQNECAASVVKIGRGGYIEAWAPDIGIAGDCKVKEVRQVATACGDGASEAVRICKYLNSLK